jgi:hypothetical protein
MPIKIILLKGDSIIYAKFLIPDAKFQTTSKKLAHGEIATDGRSHPLN